MSILASYRGPRGPWGVPTLVFTYMPTDQSLHLLTTLTTDTWLYHSLTKILDKCLVNRYCYVKFGEGHIIVYICIVVTYSSINIHNSCIYVTLYPVSVEK